MKKIFLLIYNRPYLLVPLGVIYALVILLLINAFNDRKPKTVIKPQITANVQTNTVQENKKELLHYITSSQESLNKARVLSANTSQTPEQKQEILFTVKLALETIDEGIKNYPRDDRGYAQRAAIHEAIATFSPESIYSAIKDWQTATDINQQNPQYPLKLATIYSARADFDNAAKGYYAAHLLSPTDTQIVYYLADCLEKSGQYQQANRFFDTLIALLPPNDTNIEILKGRQASLTTKIQDSKLQYLSHPSSSTTPTLDGPNNSEINPPFGIQEAPVQQAVIASNVIIAGDQNNKPQAQDSQININAMKGSATLKAGEKEIIIRNLNVSDQNFIYINPLTYTYNHIVSVSERDNKRYFKVSIDTPVDFDIQFEWWIIQ